PLTRTVSSSARSRIRADADVSGANSSPSGPLHTPRRAGRLPPSLTKAAASKDRLELAPREGSQVATRRLRSNNRAEAGLLLSPLGSVQFDSPFGAPTIPLTWAEDRALLRSNLSAVPGANPAWGGTMPPSAIRDWHPSAKSCRLRCSPALARLPAYVHSCF